MIIEDVGAYGSSMSSNYNSRPIIPEIMVYQNQSTIIKKFDALIDTLDQLLSENYLQSNAAVAVADNTRKNIDPIRPAAIS